MNKRSNSVPSSEDLMIVRRGLSAADRLTAIRAAEARCAARDTERLATEARRAEIAADCARRGVDVLGRPVVAPVVVEAPAVDWSVL